MAEGNAPPRPRLPPAPPQAPKAAQTHSFRVEVDAAGTAFYLLPFVQDTTDCGTFWSVTKMVLQQNEITK